jgi:hypothetical protein
MAKKYDLAYRDVDYNLHRLEIYNDDYVGDANEDITGRVWLSTPGVDNVHEPIQGQSLRVELDANSTTNFSDLFEEGEMKNLCIYTINTFVKFRGWVNPEGWWEDLNSDNWVIAFDAIDGLGYLEGLSYVDSNGYHFSGVQDLRDIVVNCMARNKLDRQINFDLDLRYTGIPSTAAIETHAHFNAERFYQDDEEPMSCYDVLRSSLEIFGACITQRDDQWYVYRPNQLARIAATSRFNNYSSAGVFNSASDLDLTDSIVSEGAVGSGNRFVNMNQRLSNIKSIGGFSVNYKYGPAKSLISNPFLYNSNGTLATGYAGWNMASTGNSTPAAAGDSGLLMAIIAAGTTQLAGTATAITLNVGDLIQTKVVTTNFTYPLTNQNTFYYRATWVTGGTTYYLYPSGGWATGANNIGILHTGQETLTTFLDCQALPGTAGTTGTLTITFYTPEGNSPGTGDLTLKQLNVTLLNENTGDKEGEVHTVQRTAAPSSKINDPIEVFNGDNYVDSYIGALYKLNGTSNTDEWTRDHVTEAHPILRIMCEDRLRMGQETRKKFRGDFRGYIEYLSVVSIEGVTGDFLPVEYNYNSMTNVTSIIMHQLLDDEIADVEYSSTIEYGNVVKPKIRG